MRNFHLVVGSVMGTALDLAKSLAGEIEGFGHSVTLNSPFSSEAFEQALAKPEDLVLLVCTSNTGMGDLPENILPFYQTITATPPAIAGLPYGIINLGDSSYPNFAQAGNTIDEALADIGATRISEAFVIDAIECDDPEQAASEWLHEWIKHFQ